MSQIIQVLRCYKCLVFQVHQTKKSKKWECKMCGEKQSIKRNYGTGTGKECRSHVQKLNGIRGEIDQLNNTNGSDEYSDNCEEESKHDSPTFIPEKRSKWENYIDKTESDDIEANEQKEDMFIDNKKVVLEIHKKSRKILAKEIYQRKKSELNNYRKKYSKKNQHADTDADENSSDDKSEGISELSEKSDKKVVKKFVPPPLKKDSKWEQFDKNCNNNTPLLNQDLPNRSKNEDCDMEIINNETNVYTLNNVGLLNKACKMQQRAPTKKKVLDWVKTTDVIDTTVDIQYEDLFNDKISSNNKIRSNNFINKSSKWAKFTEDDEDCSVRKIKCEPNMTNIGDNINNSDILEEMSSLCSQISPEDNKNRTACISLFDNCDLDVFDI